MSARQDTGWRKVVVGIATIGAIVALQVTGRLDVVSLGAILGIGGALGGINLLGYRSGR